MCFYFKLNTSKIDRNILKAYIGGHFFKFHYVKNKFKVYLVCGVMRARVTRIAFLGQEDTHVYVITVLIYIHLVLGNVLYSWWDSFNFKFTRHAGPKMVVF